MLYLCNCIVVCRPSVGVRSNAVCFISAPRAILEIFRSFLCQILGDDGDSDGGGGPEGPPTNICFYFFVFWKLLPPRRGCRDDAHVEAAIFILKLAPLDSNEQGIAPDADDPLPLFVRITGFLFCERAFAMAVRQWDWLTCFSEIN